MFQKEFAFHGATNSPANGINFIWGQIALAFHSDSVWLTISLTTLVFITRGSFIWRGRGGIHVFIIKFTDAWGLEPFQNTVCQLSLKWTKYFQMQQIFSEKCTKYVDSLIYLILIYLVPNLVKLSCKPWTKQ